MKTYDKHYEEMAIQPIELMQAILTQEEFIGYLKGNMIKYAMRAGHKDGESVEKETAKFRHYKRFFDSYINTGDALSYEKRCVKENHSVLREG